MPAHKDNKNDLHLGDDEIALRKQWLEFTAGDEAIIKDDIDEIVGDKIDDLIDSMYSHFLAFDETRSFFPDDATLHRAQFAQKKYFKRLTKGNYDAAYVEDRLRVGSAHHRIDLDPKWYIGAYNRVLSWLLPKLIAKFKNNLDTLGQAMKALMKLIFFDMALAIECYIFAKEAAIRQHRDAIRELETERRVTKSILEDAPVGIVSLNNKLICVECNSAFVELVGAGDRSSLVGKSIFEIAPGLKPSLFQQLLQTGQSYRQSGELLNLSGTKRDITYWDWAMWPVKDDTGTLTGLVAMFANATARVLLQQQREDFVATLTHDLKTPVLATNRTVRFLLDGDYGPVSAEQIEILETILQSNAALYELVQTLLEAYRFDSGVKELHVASCNLAVIITKMVSEIMPLAKEKGIDLKAALPADVIDVVCDESEVRRVIQNLVDNSLKFTPSGGKIIVALTQKNLTTLLSVADTGRGIPEENKPKLFQRFWQAGSTGRYYASTGLGLYLCRRIIEAHGGRIWCESEPGRGSKFYCELPNTAQG